MPRMRLCACGVCPVVLWDRAWDLRCALDPRFHNLRGTVYQSNSDPVTTSKMTSNLNEHQVALLELTDCDIFGKLYVQC